MGYYGGRRRGSSVLDCFCLHPLPYPVLLILAVVALLLGASTFMSYEDMVEGAEQQMSWAILAAPLVLILAIRWLSASESPGLAAFGWSPYYDRRRRGYHGVTQGGTPPPWGVLAFVVLLLVLASFQSSFREMWLIY